MKQYLPLLTAMEKAAQSALAEHAQQVMAESNRLAPRDTGDMVKSAKIEVSDLTVQAGYTDFVARLQHENLDYQHAGGGQAKFLETAANDRAGELPGTIVKHLRRALGG